MRHPSAILAALLWTVALSGPASAQSVDSGILGTVLDATGSSIAGSEITITRVSTGVVQTVVSDPSGVFEVRYLVPGDYTVQARFPAFAPSARTSRSGSVRSPA